MYGKLKYMLKIYIFLIAKELDQNPPTQQSQAEHDQQSQQAVCDQQP